MKRALLKKKKFTSRRIRFTIDHMSKPLTAHEAFLAADNDLTYENASRLERLGAATAALALIVGLNIVGLPVEHQVSHIIASQEATDL